MTGLSLAPTWVWVLQNPLEAVAAVTGIAAAIYGVVRVCIFPKVEIRLASEVGDNGSGRIVAVWAEVRNRDSILSADATAHAVWRDLAHLEFPIIPKTSENHISVFSESGLRFRNLVVTEAVDKSVVPISFEGSANVNLRKNAWGRYLLLRAYTSRKAVRIDTAGPKVQVVPFGSAIDGIVCVYSEYQTIIGTKLRTDTRRYRLSIEADGTVIVQWRYRRVPIPGWATDKPWKSYRLEPGSVGYFRWSDVPSEPEPDS
jgi:hypothetical protein